MSSTPPTIPPSTVTGNQTNANTVGITVRIINIPDMLQGNAKPIQISGNVTGQNVDGSINVQTPHGNIQIFLRDRGNIPVNTKIDIEIPAGQKPNQALININKSDQPIPSQPNQISSPPNKLAIGQNLSTDVLNIVLTNIKNPSITASQIIAQAPITMGQLIRLNPTIGNNISSGSIDDILNILGTLPQTGTNILRAQILSFLVQVLSGKPAIAIPTSISAQIKQILDEPENKQILAEFKNSSAQSTPSLPTLNFNKAIDGKIVGFTNNQSTTPQLTITPNIDNKPIVIGQYLGNIGTVDNQPVIGILPPIGNPPILQPSSNNSIFTQIFTQFFTMSLTPTNLSIGDNVFMIVEQGNQTTTTKNVQTIPNNTPIPILQNFVSDIKNGNVTWESLQNVINIINNNNQQQAHNLRQIIPSPNTPINAGALSLMFISMLRTGDIRNWIGADNFDLLLNSINGDEALNLFNNDVKSLKNLENTPLTQDWRGIILPFAFGEHIQKIPLYYKHFNDNDDKNDTKKKNKQLRFLFDLNLSRMGGVQIDGFMQPDTQLNIITRKLDVIIRTKQPLSHDMQANMRQIYAGAMGKSNMTGELSFQFRPEQWVNINIPDQAISSSLSD